MRENEWLEKYHDNYCYNQNCFGEISKQASKPAKNSKNSKKREESSTTMMF
jgi:hypothetical protein